MTKKYDHIALTHSVGWGEPLVQWENVFMYNFPSLIPGFNNEIISSITTRKTVMKAAANQN